MGNLTLVSPPGCRHQPLATLGLAAAWAARARRVLLLDLDPLGRASGALGAEPDPRGNAAELLSGRAALEEACRHTAAGTWLVPASRLLAAYQGRPGSFPRPARVRFALRRAFVTASRRFDVVLAHVPAEAGPLLTTCAAEAADGRVFWAEPQTFSLRRLDALVRWSGAAAPPVGPAARPGSAFWLAPLGLSPRSPLALTFLLRLRQRFGQRVLRTVVPDARGVESTARLPCFDALAGELDEALSALVPSAPPPERPSVAPPAERQAARPQPTWTP